MEEGKERSRERVRGSKKKMEEGRKILIYYNYITIFTTARE